MHKKQKISVYFQDFYKFHSSVRENVAYSELSGMNDDEAVWTALKNGMIDEYVETVVHQADKELVKVRCTKEYLLGRLANESFFFYDFRRM